MHTSRLIVNSKVISQEIAYDCVLPPIEDIIEMSEDTGTQSNSNMPM
mgnify:CR=1 FL=1